MSLKAHLKFISNLLTPQRLLLGLIAVVFAFGFSTAQQLKISLNKSKIQYLDFYHQAPVYGLSITKRRQPLLSTKFKINRDIQFFYKESWVKISYSEGGYQTLKPLYVPWDSYLKQDIDMVMKNAWKDELKKNLFEKEKGTESEGIRYEIPIKFPKVVRSIIGEGGPALRVTGYRKISLSGKSDWDSGVKSTATYKQSKFPNLHMEQESKFKITGTIGSKISVEVDQDSKAMSDLENRIHLKYTGEEDEIIKSIEAGNTNLSIGGSQFVGYSGSVQGLFGIKALAQVGKLDITMIASQERGSTEKTTFNAGAESNDLIIRDYDYVPRKYFFLGIPYNPNSGDSIGAFDLYVNEQTNNQTDPHAMVMVSPTIPPVLPEDEEQRNEYKYDLFRRMDSDEYELNRRQFYVILNRSLSTTATLGAFIEIIRGSGQTDTIGTKDYFRPPPSDSVLQDTTLVLKLIWRSNADSTFSTWENQWRNVYSLGGTNISQDGLEISIYKGPKGGEQPDTDPWEYKGKPYIQVLGLDQKDLSGNPTPDNIVDLDYVYLSSGVLIFPIMHPFDSDSLDSEDRVPEIYNSTNSVVINQKSKYYLKVKTMNRQATFSLGHANIIKGSEVVKLNGRTLQRGKDYNIIYELGQVTFLTQDATDPNANITIDYEFAPFFMPEKKSLFGTRLDYHFNDNSKLGMTALYKGETSNEQRPRVGREPTRNFVWDTDLTLNFEPKFMTSVVDALPLIETESNSSLDFQAEFAQSVPNMNTKGEAFIDDFESSREYTDLSILRGSWTLCSKPVEDSLTPMDPERSRLWWYNPYDQLKLTDIWPEREVKKSEDRTNILEVRYFPDSDSAWAGVMRSLPPGLYDQTRSKFLEIWMRKSDNADAVMHIDLGRIDEDIDGDGVLDTEDRKNGISDGVLEEDEDTGLDGVFDANEDSTKFWEPGDPHGDDWNYSDRYDYSHINGTENNREDPDRGWKPDTEDINNNGGLDRNNSYFSFSFDLDSTSFIADSTLKDGTPTGWKLYRIPIKDSTMFSKTGFPDWNQIEFARFWFTGEDTITLQIAQFQLVGNKWEVGKIFSVSDSSDAIPQFHPIPQYPGEKFEVTVKNTQENTDYFSPPGVSGERDRSTGLRKKEQSLVLQYDNLWPGRGADAFMIPYSAEDYSNYENMQMFVYGDPDIASGVPSGEIKFFFRFGSDSLNYYEYHNHISPGWATSNDMIVDFANITALKNYMLMNWNDSTGGTPDTTDGNYSVKGRPTLTTIRWFDLGLEVDNSADGPVSGEIWVDELRLTNPRNKSDWAGRMSVDAHFADFVNFSASYQRKGADFVTLLEKKGPGSIQTTNSVSGGVSLHKLFPPELGLNIPVTASWQSTLSLPRLKPGSDVVLPDELRSEEASKNTSTQFNVSERMNMKTGNWFINATLNRLSGSFSSSYTESKTSTIPFSSTDRWNFSGKYDMSIKSKPKLSIFGWTKNIFLLNKLSKSDFYLFPASTYFQGDMSSLKSKKLSSTGWLPDTFTRDLTLSGNTQYSPFNAMDYSFNFTSIRDIRRSDQLNISFKPEKLKLGEEIDYTQRFGSGWRPQILSFLDTRMNFSSNYHQNSDPKQHPDSTLSLSSSNSISFDTSLNLQKLFGYKKSRGSKLPRIGAPPKNSNQSEGEKGKQIEEEIKKSPMPGSPVWLWQRFKDIFTSLDPIRGSLTRSKNFGRTGLVGQPSFLYRFGFTEDPGVSTKADTIRIQTGDSKSLTDSYSLKSGIAPFSSLKLDGSYTQRISITRSTSEPTKSVSTTFPDISANLTGLEKIKLLKKIASSSSLQSGYSVKTDTKENPNTGELTNKDITKSFSPLFSWSLNWKNGIRTSLKMETSKSKKENLRSGSESTTRSKSSSISLSLNYSFKAPQGINLPFLKRIKFDSNLTLGITANQQYDKSENAKPGYPYTTETDRKSFSFDFNASYSFSSQISGGFKLGWSDTNDKKLGRKQHSREIGLWTEIRF